MSKKLKVHLDFEMEVPDDVDVLPGKTDDCLVFAETPHYFEVYPWREGRQGEDEFVTLSLDELGEGGSSIADIVTRIEVVGS